jgi:hypothetical protein
MFRNAPTIRRRMTPDYQVGMHVGVLAAIAIKGLPLRGEFLRNSPVLLFPEPLPYDR